MATERLQVTLQMAASQYKKEAREAAQATGRISDSAKTAGTSTQKMGQQMSATGSLIRGAAFTGAALAAGRAIGEAVERAEAMASQYAITEQVIRRTGGAANLTAEEIKELSREQSLLTGVDKQLVTESNNVLLTFKNLRNEAGEGNDVFSRTSAITLDVAAVMGNSAPAAAKQLGKALNDPISQLGALGEAGLTFTDQQEDQIKTLARSGDLLSAQKIILAELESQLGGTAAASADASDKIANIGKEAQEAFGTALLGNLEGASDALSELSPLIVELAGQMGTLASESLSALQPVADLVGFLGELGVSSDETAESVSLLDRIIGATKNTLNPVGALYRQLAGDSEELTGSTIELTDAEQGARDAIAALHDASGGAADGLEDVTESAEGAAEATMSTAEATRQLTFAYLEAANPIFAAQGALDRYASAQDRLAEVQTDSESTAHDIAAAQLEVAEAALEAEGALRELGGGNIDRGIQAISDALGVSDDEARNLLETLGLLDGKTVTSVVDVSFRASGSRTAQDAISGGSARFITGTTGGVRHSGGRVTADTPYLVGTPGHEEMFFPDRSGYVASHGMTEQLLSALRAAGQTVNNNTSHYSIPITSSGDQNTDAQLVGAVASVLRRMETL